MIVTISLAIASSVEIGMPEPVVEHQWRGSYEAFELRETFEYKIDTGNKSRRGFFRDLRKWVFLAGCQCREQTRGAWIFIGDRM
jgi:hypothetical protein